MSPYWIFLSLFILALGVTAVLKGKYVLAAVGILLPIWVWPVAAVRLAKPGSLWARSFYGEVKMGRAAARYGLAAAPEPDPRLKGLAAEIAEHDDPGSSA
jgi:hypothetical protein